MKKLLKKQGFTLVELIVVIAIMAIMLAMLIPSLSTQSSFEQEARENARAFYSNVQELMIDEKLNGTALSLSNDPKNKTNSKYTLVYAEVKRLPNTTIAVTDVYLLFCGNLPNDIPDEIDDVRTNSKVDETTNTKFQEFANSLNKLLRSSDNAGFYYAIVDDKYRVIYTYYARNADLADMKNAANFSSDYQVTDTDGNPQFVGAYPFTMHDKDDVVFPADVLS